MSEKDIDTMREKRSSLEKDVIACMLRDSSVIPDIENAITPEDFSSDRIRAVFNALVDLSQRNCKIDLELVVQTAGYEYAGLIAEADGLVPTAVNWEFYASALKSMSLEGQFSQTIRSGLEKKPGQSIYERIAALAEAITTLSERTGGTGIVKASSLLVPAFDRIEEAYKRKSHLVGNATGLDTLDDCAGGARKEFVVIGARPSIGKSALSGHLALTLARAGHGVLVFTMEMAGVDYIMRLLASGSNLSSNSIQTGFLRQQDFMSLQDAAGAISTATDGTDIPLYFCDTTNDLDEMCAKARYMVRKQNVEYVFFDHVGLIQFNGSDRMQDRQVMKTIAHRLQRLQRRLKCGIYALSQLSREAEGTKNKNVRPTIADFRESGALEEDCDQAWLMHRDRDAEGDICETEINIAKGRNGGFGIARVMFNRSTLKYYCPRKEKD